MKKISPEDAAKWILKGVCKNKAFIIFPRYNKILIWLYRRMPKLTTRLLRSQL